MSGDGNKIRGEISLPEAGKGAILRFDVNALELLQQAYGEEYFDDVMKGLGGPNVPMFRECLKVGLVGVDDVEKCIEAFPWKMSLHDLQYKIIDALFATVYGRTFEEQQMVEEKRAVEMQVRRLKEIEENPQLAAELSLRQSEEPDTNQV